MNDNLRNVKTPKKVGISSGSSHGGYELQYDYSVYTYFAPFTIYLSKPDTMCMYS